MAVVEGGSEEEEVRQKPRGRSQPQRPRSSKEAGVAGTERAEGRALGGQVRNSALARWWGLNRSDCWQWCLSS